MEDRDIIELYWSRSEDAIAETKKKYHPYCISIAYNILASFEDTEEIVADSYFQAWNAIPPTRPVHFRAFLGRITHNLAINRYRANTRRRHSSLEDVLNELEIAELKNPEDTLEQKELTAAVSGFLRGLDPQTRNVFVLRYWYYDRLSTIGEKTGMKQTTINSMLYRTRKKLKAYLKKEGWIYEE